MWGVKFFTRVETFVTLLVARRRTNEETNEQDTDIKSSSLRQAPPPPPLLRRELNPLIGTGNYSATSNNMKLVPWPLMGGVLHLVQRGGDWAGPSRPCPSSLYQM